MNLISQASLKDTEYLTIRDSHIDKKIENEHTEMRITDQMNHMTDMIAGEGKNQTARRMSHNKRERVIKARESIKARA